MASHRGRLGARVLLGVGAAFDIHAGLLPQAPRWMQRSGLEWLYRLHREPRRLWRRYLKNNPRFLIRVATSPPRLRVPVHDVGEASLPENGRSRSGAFLVLVGPDGAGKTSVARSLVEQFDGPTAYFHFRPTLFAALPTAPPAEMAPAHDKYPPPGPRALGWLRLAKHLVVCWLGYLINVRPALKRGALVVGDRWSYGYLVQPEALRFHGPSWMAALCVRLLPRPHKVVNLTASVEEIRRRKQELSESKIREELTAWSALGVPDLMVVQTEGEDPADIARRILESL